MFKLQRFKDTLECESYSNILKDKDLTTLRNIQRENITCTICLKNEIGDDFQYVFSCFILRKFCIKEHFRNKFNTLKFKELVTYKK